MNVRPCAFKTAIKMGFWVLAEFGIWDLKTGAALAGRAGRIIQRAQKAFFVGEQFHDFLLVPQMVAGGDDVHARGKNFPGGFGRDAGAAGGVFAVGDDEVERVLLAEFGNKFCNRAPARLSHDVADEKQFHGENLTTKYTKYTKENRMVGQSCRSESAPS
jgi:hypothetical protein